MEIEKSEFYDLTDGVIYQYLKGLKNNFIYLFQNAALSI